MDESIRPGIPEHLTEEDTDPREWARVFMEAFADRRDEIDEGLMLGWFANLREASVHSTAREIARALKVLRADDDLPQQGEWPCQYNPPTDSPPRLVPFLYRLLRDGAPSPGAVEEHALQVRDHDGTPIDYTNSHVKAYAESLAGFLLARLSVPEPSDPGDIDPAIERLLNATADLTVEDWPPELSEVVQAVNGLAAAYYGRSPSP